VEPRANLEIVAWSAQKTRRRWLLKGFMKEMLTHMKKSCAPLVLLLATSFAHAGISEIKAEFPNLTGPMAPAAVVTTGSSSAASYLLCIALWNSMVKPTLAWTDENGNPQSWAPPFGLSTGWGQYGCNLIRNHAGASVTVSTAGYDSPYSLSVFGFGFWPGQPQKQGGIKETVLGINGQVQIQAGPTLFVFHGNPNCEFGVGIPGGPAGLSFTPPTIFPFNAGPGWVALGQISPSGTCDSTDQLDIVSFGVPSIGSGPLKDYEYNLLDWTNATYPYYRTVFTAGASGASFLVATNIAEEPNSGTVAEELTPTWPDAVLPSASNFEAEPSGVPAAAIMLGSVLADQSVEFWTLNMTGQAWGESPTYSAEVDLLQF